MFIIPENGLRISEIKMDFGKNANETNSEDELTFISLRDQMKENGEASFSFSHVAYREDAGSSGEGKVITLIDEATATATSVWVTPYAESKFPQDETQTDGARLGRAIARKFGGENNDEVFANANETGGILTVTKNTFEDGWAWLWEIKS